MKALVFTITLLVMLLSSAPVIAQQAVPFAGNRVVTVMTRNVYNGVDDKLDAVATASSFPDLLQKVAAVYQGYFARNFPARAAALAAEIDAKRPDLIGLQEAILVRTQSPRDGPATPATTVVLDYVQILLNALAARGLHYEVAPCRCEYDSQSRARRTRRADHHPRHRDVYGVTAPRGLRSFRIPPPKVRAGRADRQRTSCRTASVEMR